MAEFPVIEPVDYRHRPRLGQRDFRPGVINPHLLSREIVVNDTVTLTDYTVPANIVVTSTLTPIDQSEQQIGIVSMTCIFYRKSISDVSVYRVFPPQLIPPMEDWEEASTSSSVVFKSAYWTHTDSPVEVTIITQCRYILGGGGEAILTNDINSAAIIP